VKRTAAVLSSAQDSSARHVRAASFAPQWRSSISTQQDVLDRVERGEADWGYALGPVALEPGRGLVAKAVAQQVLARGTRLAPLARSSTGQPGRLSAPAAGRSRSSVSPSHAAESPPST
jgi:hypothetical protein